MLRAAPKASILPSYLQETPFPILNPSVPPILASSNPHTLVLSLLLRFYVFPAYDGRRFSFPFPAWEECGSHIKFIQ